MQLTALSMGVVLTLSGAVTLTSAEESVPMNEEWFMDHFGQDWDPDLSATLFTADGETQITVGEAAKQFSARTQGIDLVGMTSSNGPEDTIVTAGDLLIIETAIGTPEEITVRCSDPDEQSHSTVSIENPEPQPEVPFLRRSHYGAASSDISTQGFGLVYNVITAQTAGYQGEVHYAGNSNFWCTQSETSLFTIVLNLPIVDGAFVGPV